MMRDVGVRELKAKASQILRNVRKRRARYVVTHRGQPVALLVPIDEPRSTATTQMPLTAQESWDELTQLGQRLAQSWPAGVDSADVLSDMRR
jgi:prevent-host-death family protein